MIMIWKISETQDKLRQRHDRSYATPNNLYFLDLMKFCPESWMVALCVCVCVRVREYGATLAYLSAGGGGRAADLLNEK